MMWSNLINFIKRFRRNTQMVSYLLRLQSSEVQTLGQLLVFNKTELLYSCKTLELPWKDNQKSVSCIFTGEYELIRRWTIKRKYHFRIKELDGSEVRGRSYILIHAGNFYFDMKGCILVGSGFSDINFDKHLDVIQSRNTLNQLVNLLPYKSKLIIV